MSETQRRGFRRLVEMRSAGASLGCRASATFDDEVGTAAGAQT